MHVVGNWLLPADRLGRVHPPKRELDVFVSWEALQPAGQHQEQSEQAGQEQKSRPRHFGQRPEIEWHCAPVGEQILREHLNHLADPETKDPGAEKGSARVRVSGRAVGRFEDR